MKKTLTLNYRSLLISRIKKKYLYLILGALVIFSISFSLLLNFYPIKLSSGIVKKNSTSKTILPQSKSLTYKVQEGDQLWLISEKFYGSGLNIEDILRSNNLNNPDLIEVGHTLIIPNVKPKMPTVGEIESGVATEKVKVVTDFYTVKEGDSLSSIALSVYGDMYVWTKIAQANNIITPDQLDVGTVIVIPK